MAHCAVNPFDDQYSFDDCCPVCNKTVAIKYALPQMRTQAIFLQCLLGRNRQGHV